MDATSWFLVLLFLGLFGAIASKPQISFTDAVYLYSRAAVMAKEGKLKLSKRQQKKDKAVGAFFD